ncbi:MAG: hypothetical protein H0W96_15655 [Solirubrobacterales bacterium]|nr:hypothetical protein [Solirubrobacterales bacterium]
MASVPGQHPTDGGPRPDSGRLTPAQAHALSRSAPLTPAQFKAHREVAERRNVPLHGVAAARRSAARG